MARRPWLLPLVLLIPCGFALAQSASSPAPTRADFPLPEPGPPRPVPSVEPRPAAPPRPRSVTAPLPVPGFGDAVVAAPEGDGPFPVVVAVHGNYDRPEWQCSAWRSLVGARAFVLCPRGVARRDSPSPRDTRFTFGSSLVREVDAGMAALREAHGARVAAGPVVYAGFSLGAIYAGSYLRSGRERVAALVLVEGGYDAWDDRAARDFARRGGRAVVFACGQTACARAGRGAAARLRAAGVESDVTAATRAGHTYGGMVWTALQPAFDRLVAPLLAGG